MLLADRAGLLQSASSTRQLTNLRVLKPPRVALERRSTLQCYSTAESAVLPGSGQQSNTVSVTGGIFPLKYEQTRDDSALSYAKAATLQHQENCFTITLEESSLCVESDGRFQLRKHKAHGSEETIAQGSLNLPSAVEYGTFAIVDSKLIEGGHFLVEATWGARNNPAARLRVVAPPCSEYGWCKGLNKGFVLELQVCKTVGSMAEVTLELESAGHWFGGGHFMRQLWPLSKASWETGPYYPFDNGPNGLNTLISPQWMTSRGLLVMADPDTPFLHVGMNSPFTRPSQSGGTTRKWGVGVQNMTRQYLPLTHDNLRGRKKGDGQLRLQARDSYQCRVMHHPLSDWQPHPQHQSEYCTVRVVLSAATDVRAACMMALRCLSPPLTTPAPKLMAAPIWTTWARYHARVDQKKVLKYAREIVDRGLQRSVMEIDDRWQSAYGDLDFDRRKFPDPGEMVKQLHDMDFKVTLWVMPFVEEASEAYKEGAARNYFVRSSGKQGFRLKPGFFHWWNPSPVCALDVTNPQAVEWFVSRLRMLQDNYGIDGFKFDAGEPCFLPRGFTTHVPLSHPTEYTRMWVEKVAGQFQGGVCEVRTGHMTQHIALMTRMGDRFSTWSITNGLRSIIPTVLTSGVLGYPFCLPDMIGGNCYFGQRPDKELMVRWTQLNALLPAMQFSVPPWDISADADTLCSAALDVRQKLVEVLLKLAREAGDALAPIARPLWWLDPHDEITYHIFDQFAVGDDIIVAPVVQKGARSRDVYLTQGLWRDLFDPNYVVEGGRWLHAFDAPLSKLPAFQRVIDVEAQHIS